MDDILKKELPQSSEFEVDAANRELVKIGLELVNKGVSISEKAVNAWLWDGGDTPFPKPDTFEV